MKAKEPSHHFETRGGKLYRILYSYGLPFSEKLGENLDDWKERIGDNKASLIVIDGPLGGGKTTLAVHCADHHQGKPITFENHLAYGGDAFQELLDKRLGKGEKVFVYDEAGDFGSKGAMSRFNRELNRLFETYRTYKVLVILVLPSFFILDKEILDKQVLRALIHIEKREKGSASFMAYSLSRCYWLLHYKEKLTVKPQAYYRVDPNFRGHFLDLPAARSAELDKFSTDNKRQDLRKRIASKQHSSLMTAHEIAIKIGVTQQYVNRRISQLALKPASVLNNIRYYDNYAYVAVHQSIKGGSDE